MKLLIFSWLVMAAFSLISAEARDIGQIPKETVIKLEQERTILAESNMLS